MNLLNRIFPGRPTAGPEASTPPVAAHKSAPVRPDPRDLRSGAMPIFVVDGDGIKAMVPGQTGMRDYRPSTSPGVRDLPHTDYGYARVFASVAWAFRAIRIRSQKMSELMRNTRLVDKETGRVVTQHAFLDGINSSTRFFRQNFYYDWEMFKSITGEAFIELVMMELAGTGVEFPGTVRVLNSLETEAIILNRQLVGFQTVGVDGTNQVLSPDDVAYDFFRDPFDDLRGLSLLSAALDAANIDRSLMILNKNFIRNNARPGLIFTPKTGRLTQVDRDFVIDFVKEEVGGADQAGEPLFLPLALDVTTAEHPQMEDQSYLKDDQKARIAAACEVPLEMIDFGSDRFQLSPEKRRSFYLETAVPEAERMVTVNNTWIIPFFDPSEQVKQELDMSAIMPLVDDMESKTRNIAVQVRGGMITFNEAREAIGKPPVAGGDFFTFPAGLVAVPSDKLDMVHELMKPAAPTSKKIVEGNDVPRHSDNQTPEEQEQTNQQYNLEGQGRKELRQWRTVALKHGPVRAYGFKSTHLDPNLVNLLKSRIIASDGTADSLAALFDAALAGRPLPATNTNEVSKFLDWAKAEGLDMESLYAGLSSGTSVKMLELEDD